MPGSNTQDIQVLPETLKLKKKPKKSLKMN